MATTQRLGIDIVGANKTQAAFGVPPALINR